MSKIEANIIAPATGTTLTLGESGDTLQVGAGASFTLGNISAGTITASGTITGPTTVTLEILDSSGTVVKSVRGV